MSPGRSPPLIPVQMEWHCGSTLSQTVYTFLYGHAIAEMHPDYLLSFEEDPSRPIELVTVVLRATALAVMKACGVAWDGMAKGVIHDVGELPTAQVILNPTTCYSL